MAGARAGFVCAAPTLHAALQEQLGPWTLSGPARHVLRHALADRAWQTQARVRLLETSERLRALLAQRGWTPTAGCGLFQWCCGNDAPQIHRALAARGIFTRLFDAPPSLRFGLPPDEAAFARLDQALAEVLP
jgi:histidinol-phosphate/aromatic aminotransferase/cobyric acid decarboxylase-like protein